MSGGRNRVAVYDNPEAFAMFSFLCLRKAGRGEIRRTLATSSYYFFRHETFMTPSGAFFVQSPILWRKKRNADKMNFSLRPFPVLFFHFAFATISNYVEVKPESSHHFRLRVASNRDFLLRHRFAFNESEIIHVKCRSEK